MVPTWRLRARFAVRLAEMYGTEVPAYHTLVDVCREVNEQTLRAQGYAVERLGSIERVTAERHGAIRVGSARELSQVARIFAGFGMYPVGFYDLRDASISAVPVVSTAFRPIETGELARNPFRVFTSMLVTEDRRFFDLDLQARLAEFVARRELFGAELLALADRAAEQQGLAEPAATRLLDLATDAFRLTTEPIDRDWYQALERISAVAADIGGVPATHVNHLTPRVLDIDTLYERMQARAIRMIDEIQGPPAWEGPDVLLRQTSFRALAEERVFRHADGSIHKGSLRVRFGEVEQRGIALTHTGRDTYDRLLAEVDLRHRRAPDRATRPEIARQVWREGLPRTETELARRGLGLLHLPGRRLGAGAERAVAAGPARRRGAGPGADRVRGLPAPLGGGNLPVEPLGPGYARRCAGRRRLRPRPALGPDRRPDPRPVRTLRRATRPVVARGRAPARVPDPRRTPMTRPTTSRHLIQASVSEGTFAIQGRRDAYRAYGAQPTVTAETPGRSVQSAAESGVSTLRPVATAVAAMIRACAPRGLPARFT